MSWWIVTIVSSVLLIVSNVEHESITTVWAAVVFVGAQTQTQVLSERKKSLQNYRAHVSKLQSRPYHCHPSSTKLGPPPWVHVSSDSCTPWGRWSAPASPRTAHTPAWSPPNWTSAQRTNTSDQAETKSFRIILTLTLHYSKVTWHSKSFHFGIVTSEHSIPRKNTSPIIIDNMFNV